MASPIPKPAEERQGRGRKDLGLVFRPNQIPAMPARLCPQAKRAWQCYWEDIVAGTVRVSDDSMVRRWITNVDRYHRLMAMADDEPVVFGSTGQPKANGLYDLALKLEGSIRADEQQLGIGPLNRLRLGVKLAEGAKSLSDLTSGEADNDGDYDPRFGIVKSA